MDDVRIERVLRTVESIPAGKVATYGDVGKVAGESPRTVGRILALWGSGVPWWRVCNAQGEIPGHGEKSLPLWAADALPVDGRQKRLRLGHCRIELAQLHESARAGLEPLSTDMHS